MFQDKTSLKRLSDVAQCEGCGFSSWSQKRKRGREAERKKEKGRERKKQDIAFCRQVGKSDSLDKAQCWVVVKLSWVSQRHQTETPVRHSRWGLSAVTCCLLLAPLTQSWGETWNMDSILIIEIGSVGTWLIIKLLLCIFKFHLKFCALVIF